MVALNFSPQFAKAVADGRKTQTIRQRARSCGIIEEAMTCIIKCISKMDIS